MLEVERYMQFDKLVSLLCRLWPMVLDEAANGWAERVRKTGKIGIIAIFQLVVALSMRISSTIFSRYAFSYIYI